VRPLARGRSLTLKNRHHLTLQPYVRQVYLRKMTNQLSITRATLLQMVRRSPRNVEQLAELVRSVLDRKDLNPSRVAARAKKAGFHITRAYVRMILNQEATNLTMDKLEALAIGLDEPFEAVLFAAAGVRPQTKESFKESVLYKLYVKSEDPRTPPEERALIAQLAEMVADHLRRKGLG